MARKRYQTQTAETLLGEDGIVRVKMFSDTRESLADAKENIAALAKLCEGRKCPVMIDLAGSRSISQDARRYYSGEEAGRHICASALIVGSPVSRVLGSFFLGLNKPAYPVRLFTSEAEAIKWLKEFGP